MDIKTKMMLLKYTDSYWMLLPPEMKEIILKYKESQELIAWRESFASRRMSSDRGLWTIEKKVVHRSSAM